MSEQGAKLKTRARVKVTKSYIRLPLDWESRFRSKPLPFQTGDKVKTPKGIGFIEAIGQTGTYHITYRVGRRTYWYGFQLSLLARKARKQ